MENFRVITEPEAAEIALDSEAGRMLVMERDFLRELVKAKDEYIACYKCRMGPTEKLFSKLDILTAMLKQKAAATILNGWTTVGNFQIECQSHGLSDDVANEALRIICDGGEVIILNGQIKACRKLSDMRSEHTGEEK